MSSILVRRSPEHFKDFDPTYFLDFTSLAVRQSMNNTKDAAPRAASVESIKLYQLQDAINGYVYLQQNWDSYDAAPISATAIKVALKVLNQLNRTDIFSTGVEVNVFPMRDGGIQFEFDADDLCAELEVNKEGQVHFVLFNEDSKAVEKDIPYYELSNFSVEEEWKELKAKLLSKLEVIDGLQEALQEVQEIKQGKRKKGRTLGEFLNEM